MIYLSSFKLSDRKVNNPNIYPYNVFRDKYIEPFVFSPITVFYGNNGSGKSTLLNIIANCLKVKGKEYATSNSYGIVDYCGLFSSECSYSFGEDDYGNMIRNIPTNSRYIKSEDILYEIKKIQQKQVLCNSLMTRGLIVTNWDCLQEPVKNLHNSSARFNSHLEITFKTAKNQIQLLATVMTMWRHRQPSKQLTTKELKQITTQMAECQKMAIVLMGCCLSMELNRAVSPMA